MRAKQLSTSTKYYKVLDTFILKESFTEISTLNLFLIVKEQSKFLISDKVFRPRLKNNEIQYVVNWITIHQND